MNNTFFFITDQADNISRYQLFSQNIINLKIEKIVQPAL